MAHYDLGNDFYKLWLDPSMSYSSALYRAVDGGDLESAQRAKYRRILRRLKAEPAESVLEIGCGWGGFAELAVEEGLKVTGLTLSPAQLAWAQKRVPDADLRLQDYRDTKEQFDHIVSIEMFEAVGERWWPTYFKTIAKSLKPGGRAVVQSITIRDDLFGEYRKGTDFIQQYVFPGGMLPSPAVFERRAASADFQVIDRHAFGPDYARTLSHWARRFDAAWPEIETQGFDTRFRRLWQFYLAYCEGRLPRRRHRRVSLPARKAERMNVRPAPLHRRHRPAAAGRRRSGRPAAGLAHPGPGRDALVRLPPLPGQSLGARSGRWQPDQPYALELRYSRDIPSARLVQASIEEMQRLGNADDARLARWQARAGARLPRRAQRRGDPRPAPAAARRRVLPSGQAHRPHRGCRVRPRLLRHLARSAHPRAGAADARLLGAG
jgi:cyclopropane fatty-acyl-phospholipid synthase-like methyltransferase